jgi:tRNA G10  N-methylase Trm11
LYDPCCGTAYLLTVLAFLHSGNIREILGSDIGEKAVALAKRNLGLLEPAGMEHRIDEITRMIEQYHKDSHRDALKSANILRDQIISIRQSSPLTTRVFQASASDTQAISDNIQAASVDIVITDVPYGRHSQWDDKTANSLWSMLEALADILSPTNVVAIISDKQQKASHAGYQRIEHFQVGKRRVVLLRSIRI